jgi:hypothetical protein
VSSVVNYYQSNGMSRGRVTRGAGFHGSLANVDLEKSAEVNHFSMVQAAQFHEQTIAQIVSLVGGRRNPLEPTRPPSTEIIWGRVDHGVQ